jgi:fatty-acyl-CoA synthase
MIIRGGENIYPHEIEQFLYHLPEIKIIQVVGVPSEKYGESVGAFIELKKGSTLQASDITDFCKDKIARYKVPKYIFFLKDGEWPLTGSGKIQKFKLKKKAVEICKKEGRTII